VQQQKIAAAQFLIELPAIVIVKAQQLCQFD